MVLDLVEYKNKSFQKKERTNFFLPTLRSHSTQHPSQQTSAVQEHVVGPCSSCRRRCEVMYPVVFFLVQDDLIFFLIFHFLFLNLRAPYKLICHPRTVLLLLLGCCCCCCCCSFDRARWIQWRSRRRAVTRVVVSSKGWW